MSLLNNIVHASDHQFAVFFAGPSNLAGQDALDAVELNELDSGNEVRDNTIYNYNWTGDVLSFSLQKDGVVANNHVDGGVIAYFLNRDSSCINNLVTNSNTWGIAVTTPAYDNVIRGNTITDSRSSAIKVLAQFDHVDANGQSLTPTSYCSG